MVGLVLSGCTDPADTGPTASASTVSTAPPHWTRVLTDQQEAVDAYLNISQALTAVETDGFRDWRLKYMLLTTGDLLTWTRDNVPSLADQGYHLVGIVAVQDVTVASYRYDDQWGDYLATLNVCVEYTGAQLVAEGQVPRRQYPDGRFVTTVLMGRVAPYDTEGNSPEDPQALGWWRQANIDVDQALPC